MSFPPLTEAQTAELTASLHDFVNDRFFDGFRCCVLLEGRGIRKVVFPIDTAHWIPPMLAAAWGDVSNYNASRPIPDAAKDDPYGLRRNEEGLEPVGGGNREPQHDR